MIWLRSAAFNAWFYGVTVVMALIALPLHTLAPARLVPFGQAWARLVLAGLRPLCGISWRVTGAEHLPAEGPALIAAMHQSAFDVLVWIALVPRYAHVMKQELTRVPAFGRLAVASGAIPVDRAGGANAMRGLLRAADKAVAAGRQIIIFPEGTRAAPGQRVPSQPGVAALAARTGLPVIPVATDSGRCWGRRAFRKTPGTITVAIQPPLPAGLARADLLGRLDAAFDAGAAALGQPRAGSAATMPAATMPAAGATTGSAPEPRPL